MKSCGLSGWWMQSDHDAGGSRWALLCVRCDWLGLQVCAVVTNESRRAGWGIMIVGIPIERPRLVETRGSAPNKAHIKFTIYSLKWTEYRIKGNELFFMAALFIICVTVQICCKMNIFQSLICAFNNVWPHLQIIANCGPIFK